MAKINRFFRGTPQQYVSQYVPAPIEFYQKRLDELNKADTSARGAIEEAYNSALLDKKAAPHYDTEKLKEKTMEYNNLLDKTANMFLGDARGKKMALDVVKKLKYDPELKAIDEGYERYEKLQKRINELNEQGKLNEANALMARLKLEKYKSGNNFFRDIVSEEDTSIMENQDIYKALEKFVDDLKESGYTTSLQAGPEGYNVYYDVKGVDPKRVQETIESQKDNFLKSPAGVQLENEARQEALTEEKFDEFNKNPEVRQKYVDKLFNRYMVGLIREHSNKLTKKHFLSDKQYDARARMEQAQNKLLTGQQYTAKLTVLGEDWETLKERKQKGDPLAYKAEINVKRKIYDKYGIDVTTKKEIKRKTETYKPIFQEAAQLTGKYLEGKKEKELAEKLKELGYYNNTQNVSFWSVRGSIPREVLERFDYLSKKIPEKELERLIKVTSNEILTHPEKFDEDIVFAATTGVPYSKLEEEINQELESGSMEVGTAIIYDNPSMLSETKTILGSASIGQVFDLTNVSKDGEPLEVETPDALKGKLQNAIGAKFIPSHNLFEFTVQEGEGNDASFHTYTVRVNPEVELEKGLTVPERLTSIATGGDINSAKEIVKNGTIASIVISTEEGSNESSNMGNIVFALQNSEISEEARMEALQLLPESTRKKIRNGILQQASYVVDENNNESLIIKADSNVSTKVTNGMVLKALESQVNATLDRQREHYSQKTLDDMKTKLATQFIQLYGVDLNHLDTPYNTTSLDNVAKLKLIGLLTSE
jgi:hypothetical protein